MAPERQLVLELVLPHVRDVKTMLACTLISTEVKHHTQRAVKHNLPALIAACPYDRYTSNSKLRYHPYLWLRGIAGDAWRSYEAGCALLGKVLGDSPAEAAEFLVKTGLQLTRKLLMHLMRQGTGQKQALLASYLDLKGAAAMMPTVYMEAATWGWCWVNGSLLRSAQKPVDNLVARVKPAQLPDVLLLLVLQAVNEKPAAEAALALLQRDKEVLKVLHRGRNAGGSSSGSGQGGGADSSGGSSGGSQGNSSAPRWMVKWWKACNKTAQEKQRQQQQQQLRQQQAVKLVEEMLTVCVTYDLEDLCQAVAALPDAKHIGSAKVTELLYVAFMQLKKNSGSSKTVLEALTALPGAAGVSPQCFDYLLRICVLKKDASKLEPVMKLPCMQQLSSTQLCSSIYRAGKAGCKTLAQQLCRLAEGRSLQRKDILKLATLLIEQPWDYAYDSITRSLEAIEVLKPGQVLTGADVLALMELCVESCGNSFSYREGWDGLLVMAKWNPAAAAVADVPRFVSVVKAATTCWHTDSGTGVVTSLLSAMPVLQQLQHSHWVLLMRSVLEQRSGEGFLRWVLQQQPGLQHMDASDLTALLVLAAKHRRSSAVAVLAGLRAAQYLNAAAWAEVLMAAARAGEDAIPVLQDLPGVQQLGQGVVADALKTAVQHGGAAATAAISLLPAAQQLEPSVVADLLQTAAKQGAGSIKAILTLPAAQELQPVVLVQALHALVAAIRNQACYDKTQRERVIAFRELCAHPLTQQVAA